MDFLKMLAELHAERQQIDQAILVVERLAAGKPGKRRGRPPKWMSAVNNKAVTATTPRKKRAVSAPDFSHSPVAHHCLGGHLQHFGAFFHA